MEEPSNQPNQPADDPAGERLRRLLSEVEADNERMLGSTDGSTLPISARAISRGMGPFPWREA